jgi:hypothetical protein
MPSPTQRSSKQQPLTRRPAASRWLRPARAGGSMSSHGSRRSALLLADRPGC